MASGAALLAPACRQDTDRSSLSLKNIAVTGAGEKLIEELAEQIIPATDTPGAKAISAHLFVLKMVDDCCNKEEQQKFIAGLKAYKAKGMRNGESDFFYATVKRLTIEAYTTSKFYLTNVRIYQLVPGHYYGCVPVRATI